MTARPKICAFALVTLLTAGTLSAADQPPANLHLVGGHWTAWNPPVPPADVEVYTIVPGDTLWDLARRFLGDPYLWPQLWERNQYILDAHWIYPGDPLVIGPLTAAAEDLETVDFGGETTGGGADTTTGAETASGETNTTAGTETGLDDVMSADRAATAPSPLGTESDIYCTGFIGELEESFSYRIVGSEFEALSPPLAGVGRARGVYGSADTVKYGLATSDIVYIDGGRSRGLEPGMVLTAIAPRQPVRHPLSDEVIGRIYHYTGRIRVLSVQETTAIAEIVFTCDPVTVGSELKPFEPEPVPLARRTVMRPVAYPSPAEKLAGAPTIVAAHDDVVALAQDTVVYIDRGASDDVTPGDIFTIYRRHPRGLPPVVIGELAVLSVRDHFAVAKIIASTQAVYRGDLLELK